MLSLIINFACLVAGALGHKYVSPFLAKLWAKVVAWFKKEETKVSPTVPTPTVTPTPSASA